METISPDQQYPTKVTSPPLTPFKITITPHQHILPPIKSLPTWNRTKLGIRRAKGPVTITTNINTQLESKPVFPVNLEQCTQTSPFSSRQSTSTPASPITPPQRTSPANREKTAYEKKIIFLQTNQKELLTNLHQELDQLKSDNKALSFKLIMAKENLEKSRDVSTTRKDEKSLEENLSERVKSLEQQLSEMKSELMKSKENNRQLLDIIQNNNIVAGQTNSLQHKKSSKMLHSKNNTNSSKKNGRMKSSCHSDNNIEINNGHLAAVVSSHENCCFNNGYAAEKCNSVQCFYKSDNEFVLPKINSVRKKSGKNYKPTDDNISLPLLQPFPLPASTVSIRRKRTKAMQYQKQRSANKGLGLFAVPKQ